MTKNRYADVERCELCHGPIRSRCSHCGRPMAADWHSYIRSYCSLECRDANWNKWNAAE